MIKNKTILLICKETFSFTMYFLGKELEKNNKVHYFFIHNSEVFTKDHFNKDTYFYFKNKIDNKNIHDVNDLNIKFLKNRKKISIDFNRLNEIEKKYTHFVGLNKQICSSQATSTPYHDRFYYPSTTYEENLYWLILNYDKAESILENIKPNYIFDLDTGEIQRTIINEIAHYKKIPYVSIEHSRYKSFNLPCFNLGRQVDDYFTDAYQINRNGNDIDLQKYINEIKDYRAQPTVMPEIYKGEIASSYDFSFLEAIKRIVFKTLIFLKQQFYSFKNDKYKIPLNTPLFSNPYKRYLSSISYVIKKFYLYSKFNKHFQKPVEEKYIYLPLHKIPESSTFTKTPMYLNEINLIEAISKSLPISWKLYVKEHQSMIGRRNMEFYNKIKKFHNVKIVTSNFYKDPKPWIEKSLGVVTITGTTAFQASMLNKPAIVFGNVFYNVISGIKVANSIEDLENLFKLVQNNNWTKDNTIDCAAYLKTVQEIGTAVNLRSLNKFSAMKIRSKLLNTDQEKDFKYMINNLMIFYENAVNICND